MQLPEMEQKNERTFLVLKIISFESETINSHNHQHDPCHWQSKYYETPLSFHISLREIFSKSRSLRLIKKYDESVLMQILQGFGTLEHFDCQRVL